MQISPQNRLLRATASAGRRHARTIQNGGYFVALPSRADAERDGEVCASCRLAGRNFAPYSPGQFGPRRPPTPAHGADLQKLQAG